MTTGVVHVGSRFVVGMCGGELVDGVMLVEMLMVILVEILLGGVVKDASLVGMVGGMSVAMVMAGMGIV